MSILQRLFFLCIGIPALFLGQTSAPPQGLPPLIDRQLLFGDPEISGPQLSPDGKYLAFLKPWNSTRNIWVKKVSEPFASARLMTTEAKRPLAGFLWSRDGRYLIFAKDSDGDENFNIFSVDPSAAVPSGAQAPPSRDLTNLKGVRVIPFEVPKSDPDAIYIGINDRDKAWHDLYRLKISTGERTLVRKNTERIAGWVFDRQGRLRLALRSADNGDTEVLRVDPGGFEKVYTCGIFEQCFPVHFHPDGKRVYMDTNHGADVNFSELVLFDPATKKMEQVESDPMKRVDFGSALFSEANDTLLLTTYEDQKTRRYFKDKKLEADYHWLEKQLPGSDVRLGPHTNDDQLWIVVATGDTEPGNVFLFDRVKRKLTQQYKARESLSRSDLTHMQTVSYRSSDGLEIPAYLTLPKGVPARGLPAVIVPHGGPWGRDGWGYNPMAQFLANRGYAVLSPNFRGSTGYGKKFLDAGNGEWGGKMQDDLTWGVKYLVAQGIADPKRVGIMGGSYGGYATLAGVAFTPDLYRAGVDIVGPSNLNTLIEAIPPYWEAQKKMMYARMADPGTPAGNAWLKERSPLTKADQIKTPLLVAQGANDPRVNRREAEQIVVALRDRGRPVEYILAPDEGHGFARPVNNMALFMAAEKFLAQQLDGRYQQGGTPETVARLAEITVDPKTVTLPATLTADSITMPKPVRDLKAGVFRYQVSVQAGAQKMAMKLTTTVTDDGALWKVEDSLETPMGAALDTSKIEKGTLMQKSRNVQQGPTAVEVTYEGGKATGVLKMNGKDQPISVDMGGPLLPALAQLAGCLPLAPGYTATLRTFDLQKQKMKLMQLNVAGMESVTVPAGTFESYKVEIAPADGGLDRSTVWVAKDSWKTVKSSAVMSQMGGATVTAELIQ
jgi:dipeptidyl aminopeptidase/acylaminoacyl peptidase